ncbi:MAG: nucleotidyltransferase [Ignavibacteria bacterium]|nr:nucleotidyltransferase [Ignavibacteria bacterium]
MAQRDALKIVNEYLRSLPLDKYRLSKAYLFGSYTKNNFTEHSDIDVALIFDNEIEDLFETQVDLMKHRRNFDLRIEPHPFDVKSFNISNPLVFEILNSGVEINFKLS